MGKLPKTADSGGLPVERKWVRKRILNHDQEEEDMSSTQQDHQEARAGPATDFDAVIVGAEFSGLYMPHSLRNEMGLSARVYEAGSDVGGTWYWNRYPGARSDSDSYIYCYSFDEDLLQEWEWLAAAVWPARESQVG